MKNYKPLVGYVPYLIYTLWVLLYHKYMNLTIPDDDYFSNILNEVSLSDYFLKGYQTWGSRLGVAYIQPVIEYYSSVFLVLDIIINISLMFLIVKVLDLKSLNSKFLLLSLLLMFNIHDMSSAGWMTTMINYLWPISALLLMALLLKSRYDNNEVKCFLPISILLLFFLGTHEQGVVVLIPMFVTFIILFYQRHGKIEKVILTFIAICFLFIIMILLSPGNANRMQVEMTNEWASPLFLENNLFDKIWLGIIRFHALFIAVPRIANHSNFMDVPDHHLTYALAAILLMHCFISNKNKKQLMDIVLACIPAVVLLGYLFASHNDFLRHIFAKPDMPFVIDYSDWNFYPPIIFSSLFVASLIIYFYRNFNWTDFILCTTLLISGLATQIMMGLTPTIYRSGPRTSVFIYFTLVIIAIFLYKDSESKQRIEKQNRYLTCGLIALLLVLSLYDCVESFLFLAPRGY